MIMIMQAPSDPVLALAGGFVGGAIALVLCWRGRWRRVT